MSAFFVIITFNFTEDIDTDALKGALDKAIDWIQYMPNCFIARTTSTPAQWKDRLRPLLGKTGHVFVCRLQIGDRNGWLPKSVWEWIRKYDPIRRPVPALSRPPAKEPPNQFGKLFENIPKKPDK
jgi:hypothetical protein